LLLSLCLAYSEAQIRVLCWGADEDRKGEHAYSHLPNRMADAIANMLNADPYGRFEADAAYEDPTVDVSQYQVILVWDYKDQSGTAAAIYDQLWDLWDRGRKIGVFVIHEGVRETFYEFCGFSEPAGKERENGATHTLSPPAGCSHPTVDGVGPFTLSLRDWYIDLDQYLKDGAEIVLETEDGLAMGIAYQDPDNPVRKGAYFMPGDALDDIYNHPDPELVKFFYNTVLWLATCDHPPKDTKVLCWGADEDRKGEHAYSHLPNRMADAIAHMLTFYPFGRFVADAAYEDPTVDLSQYQVILVWDYKDMSGTASAIYDQLLNLWNRGKIGVFVIHEGVREIFYEFCGFSEPAGEDEENDTTHTLSPPAGCSHPTVDGVDSFTLNLREWYTDIDQYLMDGTEIVLETENGLAMGIVYQDPDNPAKKGAYFAPGDALDDIYIDPPAQLAKFFYNTVNWLVPTEEVDKVEKEKKDELASSVVSYPNPLNPECYIPLIDVKSQSAQVKIYNILGQLVREIEISDLKSQNLSIGMVEIVLG
jgi:hypothetical protein